MKGANIVAGETVRRSEARLNVLIEEEEASVETNSGSRFVRLNQR